MTTLSMFLEEHQQRASREIDCYGYSLKNAMEAQMKGEFKIATIHLENAIRSLNELQSMKNWKETNDKAWLLLKQIEGSRQHTELLRKLGVAE